MGLSLTSATNCIFIYKVYYGRLLPKSLKFFGICNYFYLVVGFVGGGLYGVINSMEICLRRYLKYLRFESLGPDYNLGRLAILEIEEYRMDKKIFNDKNL